MNSEESELAQTLFCKLLQEAFYLLYFSTLLAVAATIMLSLSNNKNPTLSSNVSSNIQIKILARYPKLINKIDQT